MCESQMSPLLFFEFQQFSILFGDFYYPELVSLLQGTMLQSEQIYGHIHRHENGLLVEFIMVRRQGFNGKDNVKTSYQKHVIVPTQNLQNADFPF
ncbi:hypothetical protein D5086_012696 [Populus alba]|uniref:Uncharacterized protein n=1 Tax=Populus alba TaxID=43335 RepID=A0ACC4C2W6_POPAL